jgi:hypothetical protein
MPGAGDISGFNIAGDAVGGVIGLAEYIKTNQQLNQLESQPVPYATVSPELQKSYNMADEMSKQGYTNQEKAANQNNINRATNTQFSRAQSMGGGAAVQGALNADEIMSYDKFAAQDAELHRQNIAYLGTEADKIQEQKNKINDQQYGHRMMLEQTLGGANKAALENIMKSFTFGGVAQNFGQGGGKDSVSGPKNNNVYPGNTVANPYPGADTHGAPDNSNNLAWQGYQAGVDANNQIDPYSNYLNGVQP